MDNKQEMQNPVVAYYEISKEIEKNDVDIKRTENIINSECKNTDKTNQKKIKNVFGWCMIIYSILGFVSLAITLWDEKRIIADYDGHIAEQMKLELFDTIISGVLGALLLLVLGIVLIRWDKKLLKKQEKDRQQYVNELRTTLISLEAKRDSLVEKQKTLMNEYVNSAYYQITHNEIDVLNTDTGKMGEYLIYEAIKQYAKEGAHFLFNLYIPSIDDKTSEIDVLMICKKGIIVIESKNYSGWISAREEDKQWIQILRNERGTQWKEKFYNPIFQNKIHIANLKRIVGNAIPIYSMIVFSDKCVLSKTFVSQEGVCVIQCKDAPFYVKLIYEKNDRKSLKNDEILSLYEKLISYTETSEEIKQKHIENLIRDRIKNV